MLSTPQFRILGHRGIAMENVFHINDKKMLLALRTAPGWWHKRSHLHVFRGELMSNIIPASVVHHYKRTKIRV